MDIGTAKPDAATRARRPHHLLDLVDPTDVVFGCAVRARRARGDRRHSRARARADRRRRHDAVLQGAHRGPLGASRRRSGRACADRRTKRALRGWPALHAELARVDPATAARLAADRCAAHPAGARSVPHDRRAVVGAAGAARGASARRVGFARAGPARSRAAARSDRRSASTRCSTSGLVDELAALRERHRARAAAAVDAHASATGRRGDTWTARSTPTTLRATGIAATRQLAKRQLTWLRATLATAFDPFAPGMADAVLREAACARCRA